MPLTITPRISIPDDELVEGFMRASGPGGQNVNKVETAVQLRFHVLNSDALSNEVKVRLVRLAGRFPVVCRLFFSRLGLGGCAEPGLAAGGVDAGACVPGRAGGVVDALARGGDVALDRAGGVGDRRGGPRGGSF